MKILEHRWYIEPCNSEELHSFTLKRYNNVDGFIHKEMDRVFDFFTAEPITNRTNLFDLHLMICNLQVLGLKLRRFQEQQKRLENIEKLDKALTLQHKMLLAVFDRRDELKKMQA